MERAWQVITVVCCLWKEFPAQGWSETYVKRLRDSVRRTLRREHHFICFADRELDLDVEVRPLNPPSWQGNLPKTFVYSPEAKLSGRVLLFDLDNVIVGSLDEMADYDGQFCVRGRLADPRLPDGDMISFDADRVSSYLWEKAQRSDVGARSRQGREREFVLWAMPNCDVWQRVCPGHVVSYRHHCKNGLPLNARVVSCHGKPRPHEITDAFITEHWR